MSTTPISRFPFEAQIASMPSEHQYVIRNLWNSISDVQSAVPILKGQIDSNKSAITSTTTTVNNISNASETVISGGGGSAVEDVIGFVNNQSGNTSYQTNEADYGKIIVFDDSSPIAVTLSTLVSAQGIQLPFFCGMLNLGAGLVTLTPASGQINNASTETIPSGGFGIIYFDGTNFWAQIAPNNIGTITGVTAGTGLTGGGSSGSVTLSIAPTTVSAGSYTNTNLTVNAEGQITAAANGSSSGGVSSLNSLTGALSLTSTGSTVTITPSGSTIDLEVSGGGGYSLGGTVTSANVVLGAGAGVGATLVSISGLDGNHVISITTGTGTLGASPIYTLTFTTSRGHPTYPLIVPSAGLILVAPSGGGGSATSYTAATSTGTALSDLSTYTWFVSCP